MVNCGEALLAGSSRILCSGTLEDDSMLVCGVDVCSVWRFDFLAKEFVRTSLTVLTEESIKKEPTQ